MQQNQEDWLNLQQNYKLKYLINDFTEKKYNFKINFLYKLNVLLSYAK